jgi:Asp-tRNA(Asn)/Glu-tRNA(Gln) amidotransferase A subunit family amidase
MDLYRLGLSEALSAIANGRFTAGEYLESCIARTVAVEPAVRAFAWFDADAARASASVGSSYDALAGMPIGIKDIIRTKGVPTEMGSPAFLGHVPEQSAWVIDALADASAVMFGKTVTTEFAWRQPGATRNPWNVEHTPGGSSSGSAAAVAAGCVPGALGTQTFGSVLRPAAFCGVVGYKPSYGAIPRTGVYAVAGSLDHVGVFARNVIDAALLASVLTGRDGIDAPHVTPLAPTWPVEAMTPAPRIALVKTSMWARVSQEQQDLVLSVARKLEAQGATVTVLELPPAFDAIWKTAQTICDVEAAVVNEALAAEQPPRVSRHTIELVARGAAVSAMDYVRAKDMQQALIRAFASIMAPFDAALTAPALGEAPRGLDDTGDAMFCTPASVLGAPAISIPAGDSGNHLPLGIQLLNRWGDDRRLLETSLWVERAIGRTRGFPSL